MSPHPIGARAPTAIARPVATRDRSLFSFFSLLFSSFRCASLGARDASVAVRAPDFSLSLSLVVRTIRHNLERSRLKTGTSERRRRRCAGRASRRCCQRLRRCDVCSSLPPTHPSPSQRCVLARRYSRTRRPETLFRIARRPRISCVPGEFARNARVTVVRVPRDFVSRDVKVRRSRDF